jgi:hypothetical protein
VRMRTGNPLAEQHGRPMTVIEWIVPSSVDPTTIHTKMETAIALATLKLYNRGDNQVTGSVSTIPAPNGSAFRYVCVLLHTVACATPADHSPAGGAQIAVAAAPALPGNALALIGAAVGEDAGHVLTGGLGDAAILAGLGFQPSDVPMRVGALGMTPDQHALIATHLGDEVAAALHDGEHERASQLLGVPMDAHPFQVGYAALQQAAEKQRAAAAEATGRG